VAGELVMLEDVNVKLGKISVEEDNVGKIKVKVGVGRNVKDGRIWDGT
jgi:hypothetical protein